MPIDAAAALAARFPPLTHEWDADDVILYHLGLGAGVPPTDERELRYVYEAGMVVLPTFAAVPASPASAVAARAPGLDYDPLRLLQGEHELVVHRPIPPRGRAVSTPVVEAIRDKGKSAVVVVRVDTVLTENHADEARTGDSPLACNRFTIVLPGEGGFGGDAGPPTPAEPEVGEPLVVLRTPTLPQQNALYRLSGDRTPLHIDPDAARRVGLPEPTLPGLCTWGIVAKTVVDQVLDGESDRLRGFRIRFRGPVFPGDTLETTVWRTGNGLHLRARVVERDSVVLSHGVVTLAP